MELDINTINLNRQGERDKLAAFLSENDLLLDEDVDYALGVYAADELSGCGCMAGNVLKCIAVDPAKQGLNITNQIITKLRFRAYDEGMEKLFLFTKPKNRAVFESLGFYLLAESENAILMENSSDGIDNWLENLDKPADHRESAALVMNCNPFTNGHRYLIEKACSENKAVHLFLVREDLSVFPFEVRRDLVQKGTADLENLYVHEGRDYIISRATFPSYFIKDTKKINDAHTTLDLDLFARRIAPVLNITSRYVGEEPFCQVTSAYNSKMKELLPGSGIEVRVIKRKEQDETAISASQVRRLAASGDFETLKQLVPSATYDFLVSEEAKDIIDKIREKT